MIRIICAVTNDIVSDQRVHKTASVLYTEGYSVTVVGRVRHNSIPVPPKPYHTKRFSLPFDRGFLFYATYNIRLFVYLLWNKFDIVQSNDLDTLPASFLAAKLKRKKIVYDSHEYFTEVPELVGRKFQKAVWLWFEKHILPKLHHTYTVSSPIAEAYHKTYGIQMNVIRNMPPFNSTAQEPTDKKVLPHDRKIILYQGSVNMGRGLEQAIDAMPFVHDARLVIMGNGDIKHALKQRVQQQSLEDTVIFIDAVPHEFLKYYTQQADIGISVEQHIGLNYYYALPNKLFNYIHAGVPVLVTNMPAMAEIVKKHNIGEIIDECSPQNFAGVINAMLADAEKQKLWKQNLKIAAQELCWEKEQIVLQEIFKAAIAD